MPSLSDSKRFSWRAATRRVLLLLAANLLLALGCSEQATRPALSGRGHSPATNLLLVTVDTLRADHIGCYGAEAADTPTLDALAARGVLFENAIATAPLTLPSHASILTGLLPPHHGVRHNGLYRLPDAIESLAQRLRASGRRTGAVIGASVLAARHGLDRGFESYEDRIEGARAGDAGFYERSATRVTDLALQWLSTHPDPFFLWVHYYDPHLEYRPPAPFAERFRGRPYDGEIAFVDAELGRLLEQMRAGGRLADTLVALTADHGESLEEHGERDHSYTLYDATQRVPLILSGPLLPAGRRVAGVTSSVDIAPTLLGLLELPPLDGVDGSDVLAAGPEAAGSALAYSETLATRLDYGWAPLYAMRSATHLYVRAPRPELYSLADDPGQRENRLAGHVRDDPLPEPAASLDHEIELHLRGEPRSAAIEIDARELAGLRALGYALADAPVPANELDPKDGLPRLIAFKDAVTLYLAGDLERALPRFEAAARALPQSAIAHWMLGNALYEKAGPTQRALAEVQRASELSPRSGRYLAMRAELLRRLGEADAAAAAFERAARIDPLEPLAAVGLAWVSWRRGQSANAEAHARRAAQLGAREATIQRLLAELWSEAGRPDEAVAAIHQALALHPEWRYLRVSLALELARLGRHSESEEARRRAGAIGLEPRAALLLGPVYEAGGGREVARRLYRECLSAWPDAQRVRAALDRLERAPHAS